VNAPFLTTLGCANARVRSRPRGVSAPWPALLMQTSFEPGTFSIALRNVT
jgi:hypothetical protein